jgi:hypothetical protein
MKFESICVPRPYDIAVIMPTRGRTEMLLDSIKSLILNADDVSRIQVLLAFDEDDSVGYTFYQSDVRVFMEQAGVAHATWKTPRLGYRRLHDYYNFLAAQAQSTWILGWNDDARMDSQGWDTEIRSYQGQFRLLAFRSNHDHPYAIFPVIPADWFHVLGHYSLHNQTDAWISQIAYALGIYQPIRSYVTHERADLVEGVVQDATYQEREYQEGDVNNPVDFVHPEVSRRRWQATDRLAWYLDRIGQPTRWLQVLSGQQQPFDQMLANDTKGYLKTWQLNQPTA